MHPDPAFLKLKELITIDHMDVMAKILLATSFLTSYGYLSEQTMSWYGGEPVEQYVYFNRLIGLHQYAPDDLGHHILQYDCPAVFWFRGARRNEAMLLVDFASSF